MMYEKFKKINGEHPWRAVSPEGYIDYPVKYRKGGRVLYFNFDLARELKLIPKNYPSHMRPKLEEAILKTFSIQILNEHDWEVEKSFPRDGLEDRLYMATRYLQLQHKNKLGQTSGDGRSIWNGYVRTSTKIFDVSSRGTGTTRLSPGAQEAEGPIPTGSDAHGYASGLADLDEMLASAIMSEIFYNQGFPTERCLVVIDFKDKTGIGVRTAPNLIRPAHFFRYLKSGQWQELKDSYDYFLNRQKRNNALNFPFRGKKMKYNKSLEYVAQTYAKLAALMEEEYIFNWLAWDGDNILASGAILDYGSIRQFAAKHNKYRYEDVDRFSTCLSEQRKETRKIVQTFAQAVNFIITKEKKPIEEFVEHSSLKLFDECFETEVYRRMLWRMGFVDDQVDILLKEHKHAVIEFRKILNYFEHIKTVKGEEKVPDGIDHPPIFLVRHILRELPQFLLEHRDEGEWPIMPPEDFCEIMAASYAVKKDLEMTELKKERVFEFQRLYQDLIYGLSRKRWVVLEGVAKRSAVINYPYRSTGDGLTWIVNEALQFKDRMDRNEFQQVINRFIKSQTLIPGKWEPIRPEELKGNSLKARLFRAMQENLMNYSERI